MSAFIHILQLIYLEDTLEAKLDLLTAIGITSTNEEIFKACEEVRNEIVPDDICGKKIQTEGNELLRRIGGWKDYSYNWQEESNASDVTE